MIASNIPHSADVELWLHCNGQRFELRQIGGDVLILAKPQPIPGGEALVETVVDGRSRSFPIGMIAGHAGHSERITLSMADK